MVFLFIASSIFKLITKSGMNISNCLLFLIRLLTNQSTKEVTLFKWNFKIRITSRKVLLALMTVICCQSLSILTKAFNGLLLKTFSTLNMCRLSPIWKVLFARVNLVLPVIRVLSKETGLSPIIKVTRLLKECMNIRQKLSSA